MKKALITGITGQDGSYLTELLLQKGYEVHGIIRKASTFNTLRINHLYQDPLENSKKSRKPKLLLHYGDLSDSSNLKRVIEKVRPSEVYNLGAQSHVKVSFDEPEYTVDIDALGTLKILEAVREFQDRTGKEVRFYQASSSEMFGSAKPPQSEDTPFRPRSPYACAKVYSFFQTINYRESYGMFACNGIMFNHESERRGETFVTRKITRAATRIKLGLQEKLYLGNLDAKRDWGHAEDYVKAMWTMLQAKKPDDFVVATGRAYSVKEFAERVFAMLDMDYTDFVKTDKRYLRPAEVDFLQGNPKKIQKSLKWKPSIDLDELVKRMVENDLELAKQEKTLKDAGFECYAQIVND